MSQKEDLLARLNAVNGLLLLFDFDGTLIDIASTPDKIEVTPELKLLLRQLTERPFTNAAILSGRSLTELHEYLPASIPLAFAGCHGCELQMPGEVEESILDDEEIQFDLDEFALSLEELSDWPGILIEHKGCAVALHYRMADETTIEHATEEFYSRAEQLPNYEEMEIIEGKMVLELRPSGMNKGIAVEFITQNFMPSVEALVVYFGDDITDIDGFNALPEGSLKVSIGEKIAPYANFILDSPDELIQVIKELL
jgi:trehalose-phosphatase